MSDLKEENKTLKFEVEQLIAELERLEKEAQRWKEKWVDKNEANLGLLRNWKEDTAEYKAEVEKLTNRLKAESSEIESIVERLQTSEDSNTALKAEVERLRKSQKESSQGWGQRLNEIGKSWGETIKEVREKHKAEVEKLTRERDYIKRRLLMRREISNGHANNLTDCQAEVGRLKFEVEVLRLYGNKDCTAMADERIATGEPIE